jgi:hypothetical protein
MHCTRIAGLTKHLFRCLQPRFYKIGRMPLSLFPMNQHSVHPNLCFVLMPFAPDFSEAYSEVKKIVGEVGFKCVRADELSEPTKITDDIWSSIQRARFVIADITGLNANVFYEVGLSHALNKPVILLVQESNEVPFDLKGIRYVRYSRTELSQLRPKLAKGIKGALVTLPESWSRETTKERPEVRILNVDAPESSVMGNPVRITIKAKNFGLGASQAYFSVSFPAAVRLATAVESDLATKVGKKGDHWKSGSVILDYPIVEAYVQKSPSEASAWPKNQSHFLTAECTPTLPGLMQFYVSASAKSGDQNFVNDPKASSVLDQRDEPIYCGIVEIHSKS